MVKQQGKKAIKSNLRYMKAKRPYRKRTFSLAIDVLEQLRAVAFYRREPQSGIVEQAIKQYLKRFGKFRVIRTSPEFAKRNQEK